jgi:hypothetical protein
VATLQTRHFSLKEQDARNLFFFRIQELFFRAAAMSGATEWFLFELNNFSLNWLLILAKNSLNA